MKGWISLYRQIQDNWIWKSTEPFDKRSAWIDLLLQANYEDTIIKFDGKDVEIKQGSFITSELKLSTKWKWSRKKVRSFLESLERDNMLTKKSTTKYTTITIENWSLYQIKEQQEIQQKNNKRNTDNNINNIYINLLNNKESDFVGFKEGDEISKYLKTKGINSIEEFKALETMKQDELIEEWFFNNR